MSPVKNQDTQNPQYSQYKRGFAAGALVTSSLVLGHLAIKSILNSGTFSPQKMCKVQSTASNIAGLGVLLFSSLLSASSSLAVGLGMYTLIPKSILKSETLRMGLVGTAVFGGAIGGNLLIFTSDTTRVPILEFVRTFYQEQPC